jgi:hypothetical protein
MLQTSRVRRTVQIVAFACLLSTRARAEHKSLHATVAGDVAVTDNAFVTGSNGTVDMFLELKPGLLATYETPRMIHGLDLELDALEYLSTGDRPNLLVRGGWQGFFIPGPRSTLALSANGSTGVLNTLTFQTSPDQTMIGIQPAGAADYRSGDANELLSWQSTKETRTSETAFARWSATDDGAAMPTTTNSLETGLTLGFERQFWHDNVGVQVGGSFLRMELIAPPTAIVKSRLDRQVNPRANVTWRHDLSKRWSASADGGIVYVNPVGIDPYNPMGLPRRAQPFPIFGAVLSYTDAWGHAALSANRGVAPNLYIAQNTVSDVVLATLALPLPWLDDNPHRSQPKLVGLGSLGFERSQLVDPATAMLAGSFLVARIDVGVGYMPSPGQTYGVRYELAYQHADEAAMMVTSSFVRNTVLFTFALRYPGRVAVQIPRTQSVRADRSDLEPVGAEPVVPDATEEPPPQ